MYVGESNEAMSKKLTKSQLSVLQKERKQTLIELEHLREELKTEIELEDVDEAAPDLIERDKTQTLIFTLERRLDDIDHAIRHAQHLGYGVCEKCGQQIEPERLEIFPETTLCVSCKRKTERRLVRTIS